MKNLITIMIMIAISYAGFTQVKGGSEDFQKLFDLYVFEKYEDCAYKAESFTLKDKYKKAPEPYLYLSMCNLQLSYDPDKQEKYPKAKKEAMKYAYKFRKKDDYWIRKKNAASIYEQNLEYFDELKKAGIIEANSWLANGKYSKASYWYRSMVKVDPHDYNLLFMKGVCDILNRNIGEGKIALDTAITHLVKNHRNTDKELNESTSSVLKNAFILYTDYLNQKDQPDSAKTTITFAQQFFKDDRDIINEYNKLHGLPPLPPPKLDIKKEVINKVYHYTVSDSTDSDSEDNNNLHD